jgi:hypothetical protein
MIKKLFFIIIFCPFSYAFCNTTEEWLNLETKPNFYELDVRSLKYIDSEKKYLDVRYRLVIGGSDNQYSVMRSAITCQDTVAGEQYLWEKFNGNGDKIDVQRRYKSALDASKKLVDVGSVFGQDEIKAICKYVWKNENKIKGLTNFANSNSTKKESALNQNYSKDTAKKEKIVLVKTPLFYFSYEMPDKFIEDVNITRKTISAITSEKGLPTAGCAVAVIELNGVAASQNTINKNMSILPSFKTAESEFSIDSKNVKVEAIKISTMLGQPAQNFLYRHGSNTDGYGLISTTVAVLEPNISIAVNCGGLGKTTKEARTAFNYWKKELVDFPKSIKIINR